MMKRMMRMLRLTCAAALGAALLMGASQAAAQNGRNCAPREMVVLRLAEGYGETRKSVGLGANNAMVEVFASSETGSWTIIITAAGGLTCLVASGQSFEVVSDAMPAMDNDA